MSRCIRFAIVAFATFMLTHCNADDGDRAVIEIGMSDAELHEIISDYQCEEITDTIGTIIYYGPEFLESHEAETRWIIIPGSTCLVVSLSRLKSESVLQIDSLVKGPVGKGYPGKVKWYGLELEGVNTVSLTR